MSDTVITSINGALNAAGFHPVTDERDAAILIKVKYVAQKYALSSTPVSANQVLPMIFETEVHVVVQYFTQKPILDHVFTDKALGSRESNGMDSIDKTASDICKAIFKGCKSN